MMNRNVTFTAALLLSLAGTAGAFAAEPPASGSSEHSTVGAGDKPHEPEHPATGGNPNTDHPIEPGHVEHPKPSVGDKPVEHATDTPKPGDADKARDRMKEEIKAREAAKARQRMIEALKAREAAKARERMKLHLKSGDKPAEPPKTSDRPNAARPHDSASHEPTSGAAVHK